MSSKLIELTFFQLRLLLFKYSFVPVHQKWPIKKSYLLLAGIILISACTTTQHPSLSNSITLKPGWATIGNSAKKAASSPYFWGNLLAASLLQTGNLDRQISDQLREHTPLFGSTENAAKRSDDLRDLNELAYISSALLTPESDKPVPWIISKTKLLTAEWLSVKTARGVTSGLKSLADRERPNGENNRSFPSGHATSASSQAEMAKLNIKYLALESSIQQNLSYTLDGITGLTAWARVEAGKHYPSDVLSGWAVGYFIAQLASTFIDPQQQITITPLSAGYGNGLQLVVYY